MAGDPLQAGSSYSGDLATNMQSSTTSSLNEVVYGANSVASEESARVMSEKVQILAASIYKELETLIQKHGEESVKELMPLVVSVLESLDLAYLDKDEHVVDLEMLKEENEQLLNQYERERQMRKGQEQKYIEQEEMLMDQNRDLETKIETIEASNRMLELKSRNANDHVVRCEEREAELKQEYEKLHERYNELIRTHIEHVEKTKYMMGADKFDMMQSLPPGHNKPGMTSSVDVNVRGITDLISAAHMTQSTHASVNLANHISAERDFHEEFGQDTEELLDSGRKEGNTTAEELEKFVEDDDADNSGGQEHDADGLAADLTGGLVDPAEFASAVNDAFIGMGREVDNLIRENTELLETKNALNIVKNDLIARVDELSSENEVLREDLRSMDLFKAKQTEKIRELENEMKTIKEKAIEEQEEQEEIPMAQRKRFTRVEMARVLMEKNQYKEKLMELQEAVKFTEMQRAKKIINQQPPSKGRIWDFFSGLFGDSPAPAQPQRRQRSTSQARKQRLTRTFDIETDNVHEKRKVERRQQYKAVSQHMKKEDDSRTRAYGWSIPSSIENTADQSVPVPVCCRPLLDQQPSLKIWCASGAILYGGKNKAGDFIVSDSSSLYYDPVSNSQQFGLNNRLLEEWTIWESSSLVWVCSSNEKRSYVTVLDSNNPNCILECFSVCTSHLLCISSIPGVRKDDVVVEEAEKKYIRDGGYLTNLPGDIGATETFGQVHWVELRTSEVDDVPTFCSVDEKASPKRNRDFSISEVPADKTLEDTPDNVDEKERNLAAYANLPPHIRDALSKYEDQNDMTTALPTMWMGLENDFIIVHSAAVDWRKCLMRIKMADAVLHILHYKGLVFAALANGTIAVFHREADGRWATNGYHVIRLGQASSSVCNLTFVDGKIWAAYRNCVVIVDPTDLSVKGTFVVHPRKDSQVRHMVWTGEGVYMSIRLDSTIRLFHSKTYKHLQDVDIQPHLSSMLGTEKIDFLHLRITSLLVLNRKLWIGTGAGVIVAVPLSSECNEKLDVKKEGKGEAKSPGGLVRVYGGEGSGESSLIPYCNMSQAQFSFHGHKDSVRFFVSVPSDGVSTMTSSLESRKLLMISGGDGYIDFRLGEDEEVSNEPKVHDMSHLIVWEVDSPNPYKPSTP